LRCGRTLAAAQHLRETARPLSPSGDSGASRNGADLLFRVTHQHDGRGGGEFQYAKAATSEEHAAHG
jgi:hypothetical protein